MASIDWDFIASKPIEGESVHKTGYVPSKDSGFTVGSVDLGQMTSEDLRTIIQKYKNNVLKDSYPLATVDPLFLKLKPYTKDQKIGAAFKVEALGYKDSVARNIKFTDEEINYITKAARYNFESILESKGDEWAGLDKKTKTILASVGWQYGLNSDAFNKLWNLKSNKKSLTKALKNYGSYEYKNRREAEIDYLNKTPKEVKDVMQLERKENFLMSNTEYKK
jgi:hypothetical protein